MWSTISKVCLYTYLINQCVLILFIYCSLRHPQKYAAKRSNRENQSISTITSDRDGTRHAVSATTQPGLFDRDRHTQVKTYTDHGNGHGLRTTGSNHYSKVCTNVLGSFGLSDLFYIRIIISLFSIMKKIKNWISLACVVLSKMKFMRSLLKYVLFC